MLALSAARNPWLRLSAILGGLTAGTLPFLLLQEISPPQVTQAFALPGWIPFPLAFDVRVFALFLPIFLVTVALVASVPLGVAAGIYLSEYAPDNWLTRVINLAIINLAGVPSIVHALFGGLLTYWNP